jgi:hypothetical protein
VVTDDAGRELKESAMRAFLLAFMLIGFTAAGCVGEWHRGERWEAQTSEAPRSSPYEPTIGDEDALRKALHKNWVEVHSGEAGLVGYWLTEVSELYDLQGPNKKNYVYNAQHECIGFFTERGATYRYVFDDYKQTSEYIGRYEPQEGVAHLLGVPVPVEFKEVATDRYK